MWPPAETKRKKKANKRKARVTHLTMPFKDVPQDVKFAEEEENTLKYWDDIDAFQESLRLHMMTILASASAEI